MSMAGTTGLGAAIAPNSVTPREFLARVLPWPRDDDPGYVNMHAMMRMPDGKKPWTGTPTRDADQFLQVVHGALSWRTPPDIYMCMSRQAMTKPGKDGKIRAAKSHDQALALKGIWLDIDIKPTAYPTITAAVTALGQFIAKFNLPPPTALVASGGGMHAHWISDRQLTVAEWTPYAEGLKAAAIEFFGPLMDTGVIADCARVLRVPGTYNFKLDQPRTVKLLDMRDTDYDFQTTLSGLVALSAQTALPKAQVPVLPGKPAAVFANVPVESLSEGCRSDAPSLVPWEPIVPQCGWLHEALGTGGRDFSQGLWNLTTLAATFMENGHALAHKMAEGYPTYDHDETDALWERKLAERQDQGLGWPSCRAIQGEGCKHCATCKHLSAGKSPLHLAVHGANRPRAAVPAVLLPSEKRKPLSGGTYNPDEALELLNSHYLIGKTDQYVGIFRIENSGSLVFTPPDQFKLDVANIFVMPDGGSAKPAEKFWKEHPQRHQRRIVFKPGSTTEPNEFNLWRGFGVAPRKGWQKQRRLLRHIWEIICRRDKEKFKYLIRWLAWAVQNPDKHPETVIVLKSLREGTGKSTLGVVMLKIFGPQGTLIDDKERLLNRFNDWLEKVSFVLAEEILWAGDHRAADKLKSMITGMTIQLERKNGSIWQDANRLHVIMTTNHDHAVPAGVGNRRYVVYDISDERACDKAWFDPLYQDLNDGGVNEFLYFLQNIQLGEWHPRQILKTDEAIEQQRMTADSVSQWSRACINADAVVGLPLALTLDLGQWVSSDDLRGAYAGYCRQHGVHSANEEVFGGACTNLFGMRKRATAKRSAGGAVAPTLSSGARCRPRRPWGYNVPPGKKWQEKLDRRLGIK